MSITIHVGAPKLYYFMPFIAYYNIVNGYFKLYVNICEKLGTSTRWRLPAVRDFLPVFLCSSLIN